MEILIITSTTLEIEPFLKDKAVLLTQKDGVIYKLKHKRHTIDILISGVGILNTTYHLTKHLQNNKCDLVIQTGIAGAFDRTLKLGEVVIVMKEILGDLGVEDDESFRTLFEIGISDKDQFPFSDGVLVNNYNNPSLIEDCRSVSGLTINRVHGNKLSIENILNKFNGQIQVESMEGAALFQVCKMSHVDCFQIRAISNYVEKRSRENWKIDLAVENLNIKLEQVIELLCD